MENGQYGPIAQLGERTVRIRKVVGSIPIRSTMISWQTQKPENGLYQGFVNFSFRLK